ncbi:MAG: HesA/MoeB/ThiF family protein, partial [Prevotella sp.]|nr:HesA/MoeB/ThiF family protein [Prevotella sp.]
MTQSARYDRQLALPEIGIEGQHRLSEAKVVIIGVGGLGSPIALYLVGAGVGTVGLVDDDVVSISNLQRQVLYSEAQQGQSKVLCAKERLEQLNGDVTIVAHDTKLNSDNAADIIGRYDIVIDGTDNFATRFLIS